MLPTCRNNDITMPAVSMAVNTNTSTGEYTPEGSNHGNSPSPSQTASDQCLLSNNRTITQADSADQAQHLNAFPSQESLSENTMTDLHLLADVALKHAKGSSYTNKEKTSKTNALNKENVIAKEKKILQLNEQESNPKTHKIKTPEIYVCHFIINTLTNNICGKEFSLSKKFLAHEKTHHKKKTYPCKKCDKKFSNKDSRNRHRETHNKKSFPCNICKHTFTKPCNLKRHEKIHSQTKTFICDHCHQKFPHKASLNQHNRLRLKLGLCVTTPDLNLSAGTALKYAQGSSDTHKTIASQTDTLSNAPKMSVCNFIINTNTNQTSPQKFSEKVEHTEHMKIHDSSKYYTCSVCSKQFGNRDCLKRHLRIHNSEKHYTCSVCSKQFGNRDYLKRHLRIHNNEKLHTCNTCAKGFSDKSNLTKHLRSHTGKTYFCMICHKGFAWQSSLIAHEENHIPGISFSCDNCNQSFSHKRSLSKHLNNYCEKNKHHTCNICDYSCTTKKQLTRHRCGKRPYACQTCDKTYTSSSHLKRHEKRHEKSHSNQKTIICDRCNTTFIKQSDLNRHRHNRLGLCIITQTQADAIHSQDSADKDPNLFANTALKHAQDSSDTHKTKAAQSYELSNAPEMHACNFIINTNTNQTCPQKFSGKSNSQST